MLHACRSITPSNNMGFHMKHIAGWLQVVLGEPGSIEMAFVAMALFKELANHIFIRRALLPDLLK